MSRGARTGVAGRDADAAGQGQGKAVTVAYLGPEGTFTAEAARQAVAFEADYEPLPTIEDVVEAVRVGRVTAGVVPIENSIEGSVNLTLDSLAFGEPGVYVHDEVTIPISLSLLARPGSVLEEIAVVRSQPHALAQCRRWLRKWIAHAELEAVTSTAEAARQAAESTGEVAALGTRFAAERYGLEAVATDVQDYAGNATRFVVLSRAMNARTGADKTSLVVFFGEDRPGLLLRILEEFALRGINLTKIESRPTKQALGEYCIFIDCAGHLTDTRVGEALRGVHRHTAQLRVLGSYPRADGVSERPPPTDADASYAAAATWYEELLGEIDADYLRRGGAPG